MVKEARGAAGGTEGHGSAQRLTKLGTRAGRVNLFSRTLISPSHRLAGGGAGARSESLPRREEAADHKAILIASRPHGNRNGIYQFLLRTGTAKSALHMAGFQHPE